MNAHGIDVFDRANDDAVVVAVAHHLHLELFPAQHRLFDQDLGNRRRVQPAVDNLRKFIAIVGDTTAGAAQGERGSNNGRQADVVEPFQRFGQIVGQPGARRFQADPRHRFAEELSVLGHRDRFGRGADKFDTETLQGAVAMQGHGGIERGLPTHRRQQRVRTFFFQYFGHDFRCDRFDIGCVGDLGIGHDRRRVRIHQDDTKSLLL